MFQTSNLVIFKSFPHGTQGRTLDTSLLYILLQLYAIIFVIITVYQRGHIYNVVITFVQSVCLEYVKQ